MTIQNLFDALTPPGFCSGCGRKLTCRWRHQGPSRSQLRGVCPRCEGAEVSDCTHHWMLETPKGRLVPGQCRHCGQTRSFPADYRPRPLTPEERREQRGIRAIAKEIADAPTY